MSDNVAHAVAGACGGMASMALTYPLITVSTRTSVDKTKTSSGQAAQLDMIKKIFKQDGIKGFYSGIGSALFGISVTQGVYYYWYELVKAIFEHSEEGTKKIMTTFESMAAGAIAGVATSVITNPIWVTRLMVKQDPQKTALPTSSTAEPPKKPGFFDVILSIIKNEGFQGFFKGIMPALILVSNPIIQYTVFEKLKERLLKTKNALSGIDFFILGALSKLAATSITYPYIVVKSRMQLKDDENTRYKSQLDAFRRIIKEEGLGGLYKGIESKLLQSVMTSAFLFAFKEEFYKLAIVLLVKAKLRTA